MSLPIEFLNRMKDMLGEEYEAFLNSMGQERSYGLRINPLHPVSPEALVDKFGLKRIPWASEGYFYDPSTRPGHNILHEAGAYYIQEPSAMLPAELADVKPGEYVCDLCASPGGKSTQVLGKLGEKGFLLSNEIVPQRARVLSQNIERYGSTITCVTNEDTSTLATQFADFFDVCIVDAPCSGEGMFRKDDTAVCEWSPENVIKCQERQLDILENANVMLKDGGRLVYSTCTFAPQEDEVVIAAFLGKHPEYELVEGNISRCGEISLPGDNEHNTAEPSHDNAKEEIKCSYEITGGNPDWAVKYGDGQVDEELVNRIGLEKAYRVWPHKTHGEGHFAALLIKKLNKDLINAVCREEKDSNVKLGKAKGNRSARGAVKGDILDAKQGFLQFAKEALNVPDNFCEDSHFVMFGDHVYLVPGCLQSACATGFRGYSLERCGLELGELHNGRFLPAHALSHALNQRFFKNIINVDEKDAAKYICGETINAQVEKGWALVCFMGAPLGLGKVSGNVVKNHYPKGLRINGYK